MAATVTINDVLDGHVALDIECLDRIYLNGYVPTLQTGGAVVSFLTAHLDYEIPSPASPRTARSLWGVTGEGKAGGGEWSESLLMPRDRSIPGWNAAPG